ncbi:MAG: DNA polymerase I [Chloroflexi bacterium]|nr:DNA polymerase I [Chloroflexota bacterium]
MVIDGHALVHRSFHAFAGQGRTFTVPRTGEIVTAVYGFASVLLKALAEIEPQYWAVTFDLPVPTFRHQRFAAYKLQRPPTPQELVTQVDRVHHLAEAFGLPIFEVAGFEADDVIGTLCHQAAGQDVDCMVLTGDTDTLQLAGPHVRVRYQSGIQQTTIYDEQAVRQRYGGLSPSQLPDYKALTGDKSDNIPGVPGVGEKTATRLLLEFGSLEGLYASLEKVTPDKLRSVLSEHRDRAFESKALCTILREAPVAFDPEVCFVGRYDRSRVVELFRELEFASLVKRLPDSLGTAPAAKKPEAAPAAAQLSLLEIKEAKDYTVVDSTEDLALLAQALQRAGTFAVDVEASSLDSMSAELVGISLAVAPGEAWYVPVGHSAGQQVPLEEVSRLLGPVLADKSFQKVAHNANYDMMVLSNAGLTIEGLAADTMVAAHLLGERSFGLKALALTRLNVEMTSIEQLIGTGKKQRSFAAVPIGEAVPYSCADADCTLQLWHVLEPELKKANQMRLFQEVEVPLVPVLVRMQRNGIAVNLALLGELGRELNEQIMDLEARVYNALGHRFNINSSQQLSQVLFTELGLLKWFTEQGLPRPKRTQSGYTTDAQVLESLKGAHPVVELILDYRQLTKLKSTYVDALPALVNPQTRRIHTSFNQTGAVTGRLSSSDPNHQTSPIRTELGRRVRSAFIAQGAPQWQLLSADYSQVELRILAHFSRDEKLVEAFEQDKDIHAATASEVFGVPLEQVSSEQRRFAKMVNFGILYGMGEFGLAQRSDLTREEAGPIIQSYFAKYPGISRYLDETKRKARALGYVETLLGRRRSIPEVNSTNAQVRAAAERMAVNMPIQGTAADIIKVAMVRLQEHMGRLRLRSKMLLQVHDELIFEVPGEELEQMTALVLEIMPNPSTSSGQAAIPLSVPLKVDVKVGRSWGEMK